ncbi:MAG: hypothetical protein AAGE03_07160 [Pseudomonadota bacterium]
MTDDDSDLKLGEIDHVSAVTGADLHDDILDILTAAQDDPNLSPGVRALAGQEDLIRIEQTAKSALVIGASTVAVWIAKAGVGAVTGLAVKELWEYVKDKLKDRRGPGLTDIRTEGGDQPVDADGPESP